MKEKIQGIIAGWLMSTILIGGYTLAADFSETVDIFYRNIKLYVDGAEYVAKDGNGNVVEPFIYNGTTYLPVRGVADAFGKDVVWDGATSSIFMGKRDQNQPDNYLHKVQYNDYKSRNGGRLHIINGTVTDYNGTLYTNGILFLDNSYESDSVDKNLEGVGSVLAYPLNSQYKTLTGKIVLPKSVNLSTKKIDNACTQTTDVLLYGDGGLLYKATGVTASMPFQFNVDISGVNLLRICIRTDYDYSLRSVALTDLALYK